MVSGVCAGDEDWGKVSKEILGMRTFAKDSSADAIILFEKGEYKITDDFQLKIIVHRRMKIFNEEGKEAANVTIKYDPSSSQILELKAQTILPSGKKIRVKEFFDEKVGDWMKQKKFTFPGVENGAVVEYRFVILMESLVYPPVWNFQHEYYTLKSELEFVVRQGFVFNVNYINPLQLDLTPEKEEYSIQNWEKVTRYHWIVENIPPFDEEPYMPARKDFITSMIIQFQEYRDAGYYFSFVKSWNNINEMLMKDYREFYNADRKIEEILGKLQLDSLSSDEKVKIIYDYVRDSIKTDGGYSLFSFQTASDVLEKGKANSSDKNLLLVYLLNKAGFQAYPMLISSRSHGQINVQWPALPNFNRVLAYLQDGVKTYYLDASYDELPFDLPAPQNNVEFGFVVGEGKGNLIALKKPNRYDKKTIYSQIIFNEDGDLKGECSVKYEDYAAFFIRQTLKDKSAKEVVKSILEDWFTEFELDTVYVENQKMIDQPVYIKFKFIVPMYLEETGNQYYVSIPVLSGLKKNPFRKEKRYYPISFSTSFRTREVIEIILPNTLTVVDLPKPRIAAVPQALQYKIKASVNGQQCTISREFERTRNDFSVREYAELKEFYGKCVSGDNIQIILKRNEQ